MSDNKITSKSNNGVYKNTMDLSHVSAQFKKGYKGDMTSKEAGNMVKAMIQEQEKKLMEKYNKTF
ncbi:small, acid-soluble spore protein, alpha/beta type [Mobilitalea sibirica]|uniref:Small, acid-soluble spore protein, alpha/beta type n=1 Tax=Mobilitalea sibirica TaxID=1462919 RepID=A0A8J7HB16_9FIRM|nr:small, acid-soluble spore protein, alpha/beta type [Mobilitalea sibirica]MBH1939502.1 small, acid-soluble spore protein, alpha/beta type [Mobilitalea sibirica]